jgi:hypothetical protein
VVAVNLQVRKGEGEQVGKREYANDGCSTSNIRSECEACVEFELPPGAYATVLLAQLTYGGVSEWARGHQPLDTDAPVHDWLTHVHPELAHYAASFAEYGYTR